MATILGLLERFGIPLRGYQGILQPIGYVLVFTSKARQQAGEIPQRIGLAVPFLQVLILGLVGLYQRTDQGSGKGVGFGVFHWMPFKIRWLYYDTIGRNGNSFRNT